MRVELISHGQGMNLQWGFPQKNFKLGTAGFNTYKIALKSLTQPQYAPDRVDAKEVLKKLTQVDITVYCEGGCSPINGTVVIDNVIFTKVERKRRLMKGQNLMRLMSPAVMVCYRRRVSFSQLAGWLRRLRRHRALCQQRLKRKNPQTIWSTLISRPRNTIDPQAVAAALCNSSPISKTRRCHRNSKGLPEPSRPRLNWQGC